MKDEVQYNNRKYVSISEFARRVGATRRTIEIYIKNGRLQCSEIDSSRHKYLDWELQERQFKLASNSLKNGSSKRIGSKDRKPRKKRKDGDDIQTFNPKTPSANAPTLGDVEIGNIPEPKDDIAINLSSFDPVKYSDCLLMDDSGRVIRDGDGKAYFDYDRLKLRLTAEKYQLDIDQKRGLLVEKEELTHSIDSIGRIIISILQTIPQRYASQFIAYAELKLDNTFSQKQKVEVREMLTKEAKSICETIQKAIADTLSEGE